MPKNDPLKPPLSLLCKLASVAVHAAEMLSEKADPVDKLALQSALGDQEVLEWLEAIGPFAPVKR